MNPKYIQIRNEKGELNMWNFYKKYIEPFVAVFILVAIGLVWLQYFTSNQLQRDISINCGWSEDDYQCYCAKGEAMKIKNLMENPMGQMNFSFNMSGAGLDKAQEKITEFYNPKIEGIK